jgi:hypothetical protein
MILPKFHVHGRAFLLRPQPLDLGFETRAASEKMIHAQTIGICSDHGAEILSYFQQSQTTVLTQGSSYWGYAAEIL